MSKKFFKAKPEFILKWLFGKWEEIWNISFTYNRFQSIYLNQL